MLRSFGGWVWAGVGFLLLSCGGKEAASPAAAGRWKDLKSKDQEIAFMKAVVKPRMGKVFQGHDPKRYDEFGCKTCHGPAGASPQAFLPKLTMKDGKLAAFSEKPEVSKFMAESVVPEMAAAMGEPPYDPATQQGFGCGGCHAIGQLSAPVVSQKRPPKAGFGGVGRKLSRKRGHCYCGKSVRAGGC